MFNDDQVCGPGEALTLTDGLHYALVNPQLGEHAIDIIDILCEVRYIAQMTCAVGSNFSQHKMFAT